MAGFADPVNILVDDEFENMGSLQVTVPASGTELEPFSGAFAADFDVSLRSQDDGCSVRVRLKGKIGDGGCRLSFKTVDGDVRLRTKHCRARVIDRMPLGILFSSMLCAG